MGKEHTRWLSQVFMLTRLLLPQLLDLDRPRRRRRLVRCVLVPVTQGPEPSVRAFPPQPPFNLVYTRDMQADSPLSRLWRSSHLTAIVSCYLMWLITFLAQLHPLISPRRSDFREAYLE